MSFLYLLFLWTAAFYNRSIFHRFSWWCTNQHVTDNQLTDICNFTWLFNLLSFINNWLINKKIIDQNRCWEWWGRGEASTAELPWETFTNLWTASWLFLLPVVQQGDQTSSVAQRTERSQVLNVGTEVLVKFFTYFLDIFSDSCWDCFVWAVLVKLIVFKKDSEQVRCEQKCQHSAFQDKTGSKFLKCRHHNKKAVFQDNIKTNYRMLVGIKVHSLPLLLPLSSCEPSL